MVLFIKAISRLYLLCVLLVPLVWPHEGDLSCLSLFCNSKHKIVKIIPKVLHSGTYLI